MGEALAALPHIHLLTIGVGSCLVQRHASSAAGLLGRVSRQLDATTDVRLDP
jgi:hypothetical protein